MCWHSLQKVHAVRMLWFLSADAGCTRLKMATIQQSAVRCTGIGPFFRVQALLGFQFKLSLSCYVPCKWNCRSFVWWGDTIQFTLLPHSTRSSVRTQSSNNSHCTTEQGPSRGGWGVMEPWCQLTPVPAPPQNTTTDVVVQILGPFFFFFCFSSNKVAPTHHHLRLPNSATVLVFFCLTCNGSRGAGGVLTGKPK